MPSRLDNIGGVQWGLSGDANDADGAGYFGTASYVSRRALSSRPEAHMCPSLVAEHMQLHRVVCRASLNPAWGHAAQSQRGVQHVHLLEFGR